MQGINVISSEQLTEFSTVATIITLFVLIVIMVLVNFTVGYLSGERWIGNVVSAFAGIIMVIVFCVIYYGTNLFKSEIPYHKYTVVISDDVTVNELSSRYKIIEIMDNNTYVITDKLDYDGE